MNEADAYVALALAVIGFAASEDDLRTWWAEEDQARTRYGLTRSDTSRLIIACRGRVAQLREKS